MSQNYRYVGLRHDIVHNIVCDFHKITVDVPDLPCPSEKVEEILLVP